MTPPNPLEFATTEEIVQELRSRNSRMLVFLQKAPPNGQDDDFVAQLSAYVGGMGDPIEVLTFMEHSTTILGSRCRKAAGDMYVNLEGQNPEDPSDYN